MKKVKEKTYFECLNEISQNKLFKGLLGYGMFAERIPNFLTSKPFYKYCKNNKDKIFPKRKMGYQYITYEGIRDIGTPRYFAIPNPLAYYNQCKILRDNWDKLKEYFKEKTDGNTHKISRIHIQKIPKNKKIFQNDYSKDRVAMRKSIFDMGHKDIFCEGKLERSIRIGARYKLKADISTCFPSIYTHSIPWAIRGKEIAKKDKNHWSDEIDTQTRNMNHKETTGILIGPHSSNLISEIILVAVDD
ncbi:hypothetical protein AOH323_00810 [Helicobacter pylori]